MVNKNRTFLREPFFHFLIFGIVLFAGHQLWEQRQTRLDKTILVSTAEIQRQADVFAGENQRIPSDDDIQALIFAYIEQEALAREATRRGLAENDLIIQRRLAQKMRFVLENNAPREIDDTTLEKYYTDNPDIFTTPANISFRHIYLSPESRKGTLDGDAVKILQSVQSGTDWETLGDPFIMQRHYNKLAAPDLSRLFGDDFAKALFEKKNTGWHGPVQSAFGLHIVAIDSHSPAVLPRFQTIKDRVKIEWEDTTRRAENRTALKQLIESYTVQVEGE